MRLTPAPGADLAALVRGAAGESIVVVIAGNWPPLDFALATAAIAPLAIERAPATRVNAVIIEPGASPDAAEAAIAFLERARSTTGQLLTIS